MQSGSKGFGMRKHGKTGWKNGAGKPPKFRANAKREAEKNIKRKPKTTTVFKSSIKDLIENYD